MDNQDKIQEVRKLAKELDLGYSSSPATHTEIEEMEFQLNVKFPKEYKEFLETFGYLGEILGAKTSDGISWAVKETLSFREGYPGPPKKSDEFPKFPDNVVVVHEDGFGNAYCVVCSGKDQGKVIFWQHDVYSGQEYPNYPEGKPDFWIEGPDFWTWLLEKLQRIKKIEEEEKKKEKEEIEEK